MDFEHLKSTGGLEAKLHKSLLNIKGGEKVIEPSVVYGQYGSDLRCSDEGIGIKFRESCAKKVFSKCVHHLVRAITHFRIYGIRSNLLT